MLYASNYVINYISCIHVVTNFHHYKSDNDNNNDLDNDHNATDNE